MKIIRAIDRQGKISLYNIDDAYVKKGKRKYNDNKESKENGHENTLFKYGVLKDPENSILEKKIVRIISKPFNIQNNIESIPKIHMILNEKQNDELEKLNKKSNMQKKGIIDTILKEKNKNDYIRIVDAFYDFFDKKLIIIYYSENRIDFRNIVKKLAKIYKTRIEMKQLNEREYMSYIGGIGDCGRILCCKTKRGFSNVNMEMIKEQNISCRNANILGACGKIKCCMNNEYDLCLSENIEGENG